MTAVHREYLTNYLHFINENIDTFNKADQLSDELRKMMYTPYTYQTECILVSTRATVAPPLQDSGTFHTPETTTPNNVT